ncbi:unnamed protein product, partial [Meganyctiphanes norvegica]
MEALPRHVSLLPPANKLSPSTAYSHYGHEKKFFLYVEMYLYRDKSRQIIRSLPRIGIYGKNQMLFDLGYPDTIDKTYIYQILKELEQTFQLVMISDRLDESLILLRHLLCWEIDDVITFTKNARIKGVTTMSSESMKRISLVNAEDMM